MINNFLYSIAGKKTNVNIDNVLQSFLDSDYTPSADRKIILHVQEVAKQGNYPSAEYFSTFYPEATIKYSNIAELTTYAIKVLDFYKVQSLQKNLISAINDANNSTDLLNKVEGIISSTDSSTGDDDLSVFKPVLYSDDIDKPETKGVLCGVSEIDEKTNGFQAGTIAAICAFTGHGKTTFTDSIIFKNALEGKKTLLFSLEMAPELIWPIFQARYLYQVKGLQVSAQDIIMHKLPSDLAAQVSQHDQDFLNDICKNIMIVDESVLNKRMVVSPRSLQKLFSKCESVLGGLDLVVFDHVGQFELLFPEMGNQILKAIQTAVKTYPSDNRPVALWAVQTNREGMKRCRKNGHYDLQAIADLNEVERSSSYIIFMYTSDDDKVNQETHMTLSKHRLGEVISEPVTTTFAPNISTVGSAIESLQVSDDDINSFGSFDFGGDDAF